ncbi:WhiB family transcriptional regulator [Georgenia sp. TF02-10]|uniref:WhiB family transcriptional regulator n=1 Tax=Georgenia sp. TF02-10 TaxID=2917725 RepID=UPI001FA79274|nr:WhiB family transcriptional regulator [Georgenia sp. TF02-10]UNX54107.1 WhiB family transcriptional regulator [Georgenia sp. TF02-10]
MSPSPWGGQSARERTPFGAFQLHPTHLTTGTVQPRAACTCEHPTCRCGKRIRPSKERAADHPGTVRAGNYAARLCKACAALDRALTKAPAEPDPRPTRTEAPGLAQADVFEQARCRQCSPECWFPPPENAAAVAWAVAQCQACPALTACRRYILAAEAGLPRSARHGIAAGMTPRERAAASRKERTGP